MAPAAFDAEKPERQAVLAMRARGLNNPEELLECADAETIIRTCEWWDRLSGVRPGLLAKRIREGGVQDEQPQAPTSGERGRMNRERFARLTSGLTAGSVIERHVTLQERRGDLADGDERCDGALELLDDVPCYPVLAAMCNSCGLQFGYTLRTLGAIRPTTTAGEW